MNKYLLFFLLSLILYSSRVIVTKQGVYGDGNAYWSYAHALTFKGSLDFTDVYQHLSHFQGRKYQFSRVFWRQGPTSTGMLPNQWLIGPSLLWLPLLVTTHFSTILLSLGVSPYSVFWEFLAGLSGITFGLLGLYFLEKTLHRFFDFTSSTRVIWLLFLTTHLFFYIALEPVHSHSSIFFLICFLIFFVTRPQPHGPLRWFIPSLLVGLIAITRPSGIASTVLFLPLFHSPLKSKISDYFTLALGFLVGIFPQLLTQYIIFGSVFSQPYLTGYHGQATFSLKFIPLALFSAQRGLFIWTPILLIGLFGLIQWTKNMQLRKVFILYLLIQLLIVGTWNGIISAGYGNRFFIETLPIYAFGFAHVFSRLSQKTYLLLLFGGLYWNLALLTQFFLDKPRLVDLNHITYPNLFLGQFIFPIKALSLLQSHGILNTITQFIIR